MLKRFQEYIKNQCLFSSDDRILLAVSGGMDSMVMSHLFAQAGFSFAIAHCNFQLRGADSDADATFVETTSKALNIQYYRQDFDTKAYVASQRVSTQMAARRLRYEWLEAVRLKENYNYIATAHHLNDSIETMIYNLTKGCGIRGLHGISPKNGKIIRPLLFAERREIADFVTEHQIAYREDASNASDKYSRNFIRHQVIPQLKTLNSSFEQSTKATIQNLRETEFIFHQAIADFRTKWVEEKGDTLWIDYKKIPKEAARTILYEFLRPMGFHGDQILMLLNTAHQSGISFSSKTHELLVDRDYYIVRERQDHLTLEYNVEIDDKSIHFSNRKLSFEYPDEIPNPIPGNPAIAVLDLEQLQFPLRLRPWTDGDIFQPFGMHGQHQKLKDFLTHRKLNRFEKEQVYVLESAGKICWIVGFRIDERFRINAFSKKVCVVRLSL